MATPVGQAGLIYKGSGTQPLMLLLAIVIRHCGLFFFNTHLMPRLYINEDNDKSQASLLAQMFAIKSLLLPKEELFCLFTPLRHVLSSPCSKAFSLPGVPIPSQTALSCLSPVSPAGPPWHTIQVRCRGLGAGTEERGDVLQTWICGSPITQ